MMYSSTACASPQQEAWACNRDVAAVGSPAEHVGGAQGPAPPQAQLCRAQVHSGASKRLQRRSVPAGAAQFEPSSQQLAQQVAWPCGRLRRKPVCVSSVPIAPVPTPPHPPPNSGLHAYRSPAPPPNPHTHPHPFAPHALLPYPLPSASASCVTSRLGSADIGEQVGNVPSWQALHGHTH